MFTCGYPIIPGRTYGNENDGQWEAENDKVYEGYKTWIYELKDLLDGKFP
jgi:hypothetical protein